MVSPLNCYFNFFKWKGAKKLASNYQEQINDLMAGKIKQISVPPAEFMAFRRVWLDLPQRKEIVGVAQRNGTIIYHFDVSGNLQ